MKLRPPPRRATAQLGCGILLVAVARFLGHQVGLIPGGTAVDVLAPATFVAGLLFGPTGVLGGCLGSLLIDWLPRGAPPEPLFPLADLLVGLTAFGFFRFVPRVGRNLPDLRSYLTFLAAAAASALLAALGALAASPSSHPGRTLAVWWTSLFASLLFLAPPAALLLHRLFRPLLWPLRREVSARPLSRWIPPARGRSAEHDGQWQPAAVRRLIWLGPLLATLAVGAIIGALGDRHQHAFDGWLELLFLLPILWAAAKSGLRGGILTASLASFVLLAVHQDPVSTLTNGHLTNLARHAGLVVLPLFGALVGGMRQREGELRDRLESTNRRLRRDLERVVRALQGAMAAKDTYTEGHLRRVSSYALAVGQELDLSTNELELLGVASLLHDVGKVGIAESVLNKDGPLDPAQQEHMQRHPEIGARILHDIDGLSDAAPLVLHHQERWDGLREGDFPGYPVGLTGDAIPLGARIIAVVDAFDAMTSDRPYRKAMPVEAAMRVLQGESGSQFDPRVVDTFVRLLTERPWDHWHEPIGVLLADEPERERAPRFSTA